MNSYRCVLKSVGFEWKGQSRGTFRYGCGVVHRFQPPYKDSMTTEIRAFTGGFTATNGYSFQTSGGLVVIDAPQGMAGWLAGQNLKASALFLTHWHFDHVMDAARIAREHGCPVYAWRASTRKDRLDDMVEGFLGQPLGLEDYPVDFPLEGHTEVIMAGTEFLLRHVPGHSPDSLVLIHEPSRVIFSGDTVMDGGIGRSDFPDGDFELLVTGIRRKILAFPGDFRIFPGHGGVSTVQEERDGNVYLQ